MFQGLTDIRFHAQSALKHDAQIMVGVMVAGFG